MTTTKLSNDVKETTTPDKSPKLDVNSQFASHLASYPAVSTIGNMLYSLPGAQLVSSNVTPVINATIEKSQPILGFTQPYLQQVDALGDRVLTHLDNRFSSIKTVTPGDLVDTVSSGVNQVGSTVNSGVDSVKAAAASTYDATVKQPLNSVTSAVSSRFEAHQQVLDKQLESINDRLAQALESRFPEKDIPHQKEGQSQIERTQALLTSATSNLRSYAVDLQSTSVERARREYGNQLSKRDSADSGIVARYVAAFGALVAVVQVLARESADRTYKYVSGDSDSQDNGTQNEKSKSLIDDLKPSVNHTGSTTGAANSDVVVGTIDKIDETLKNEVKIAKEKAKAKKAAM